MTVPQQVCRILLFALVSALSAAPAAGRGLSGFPSPLSPAARGIHAGIKPHIYPSVLHKSARSSFSTDPSREREISTDGTDSLATTWVRTYQGAAAEPNDQAYAIAVHPTDGSVYITGASYSPASGYDIITVKYSGNGDTAWTRKYNGEANSDDYGITSVLLPSGDLVIAGITTVADNTYDIATICYSSAGARRWVQMYDGPSHIDDTPSCLATDQSGNIFLGGSSTGADSTLDALIVSYTAGGALSWAKRYASNDHSDDIPIGIAFNSSTITVAGNSTDEDGYSRIFSQRYSSGGALIWSLEHGVPGSSVNEASALQVSPSGTMYIAGRSYGDLSEYDYLVLAYSSSGSLSWSALYDGPASSNDEAFGIAYDAQGGVVVTGGSTVSDGTYDIATIKYSASGSRMWTRRFSTDVDDIGYYIATDRVGNIYVAGSTVGTSGSYDFTIVKYSLSGSALGAASQDGRGGSYDYPTGLALDAATNIFICGNSNAGHQTSISVVGLRQIPSLHTSVNSVTFSTRAIGSTASSTLFVSNSGSTPITVAVTQPADQDFIVSPTGAVIGAADSVQFTISFSPLAAGTRSGTVMFSADALNSPKSIALTGTGTGTGTGIHIGVRTQTGWQMVSLPVRLTAQAAQGGLFRYSNGYVTQSNMETGVGYWKKLTDTLLSYSGYSVARETVAVNFRWNMIGSVSAAIPVSALRTFPPAIISGAIYHYDGFSYQVADSIRPGRAYWVRTTTTGQLYLGNPATEMPGITVRTDLPLPDRRDRFMFTDGEHAQVLSLIPAAQGEPMAAEYELPPPPPQGSFDARFEGGFTATGIPVDDAHRTIILQTPGAVAFSWQIEDGREYTLTLDGWETILRTSGELTIPEGEHRILLSAVREEAVVPARFALLQNYPNPFNPTSVIPFDVPSEGQLTLYLVDAAGKRSLLLPESPFGPGRHTVRFNARGYASGTYFCVAEYRPKDDPSRLVTSAMKIVILK